MALIDLMEWIPVDTIKVCVRHASESIAVLSIFYVVGLAIHYLVLDPTFRAILGWVDDFLLVIVFMLLGFQLFCILWNRRVRFDFKKKLSMDI